ncbi:dihydroorotate dehydrogenase electron transfer subunit [Desulfovirgula thermocuniculi]|uniref:dihydroorotate dehydrogenase electron transfer subunit n=1 Tax=Desulfovirgula thermocuniculi TaxID=348842 RepID=UPI00048851E5|nr:dihydroorotate dehydrogenase electron transfer subunit [Desulfovirgula thermocuniculi]
MQNKKVGLDVYRMELFAPDVAAQARPGQFLHVSVHTKGRGSDCYDPLLRRPLSVHGVDVKRGAVALLYRVVGRGTALLARVKEGELLDVLGPLGRGFSLPPAGSRVVLVAGGMGVAPLYFLAEELLRFGHEVHFLAGARRLEELYLLGDLLALEEKRPSFKPSFATDDGSYGFCGPVTGLLEVLLAAVKVDRAYACGPRQMLREAAGVLARFGVPGEVSLEERMGCGVGACLSCACRVREAGGFSYRRVCADGPVFAAESVDWEDR